MNFAAEKRISRRQRTDSKVPCELPNFPGMFHSDLPRVDIGSVLEVCSAGSLDPQAAASQERERAVARIWYALEECDIEPPRLVVRQFDEWSDHVSIDLIFRSQGDADAVNTALRRFSFAAG